MQTRQSSICSDIFGNYRARAAQILAPQLWINNILFFKHQPFFKAQNKNGVTFSILYLYRE
jgi:hypothetical protein